ncbi:uncharacterized protein LOC131072130 [Cryptomeria japonica]|uniref:uncharacterized protein LOC131072130 n=1 Tax=Cryptomeria japonica TaxID=3369 RepID=UPI0025ABA9D9|nr:uncharacterized protein LOC131072130 [Cryptomeria japonica]
MARSDRDGVIGCACYCCPPRESEASTAIKVEAVHPSNWHGEGQMLPNGNTNENVNGKGDARMNKCSNGMPLKSNLKRPSGTSDDPIAGDAQKKTGSSENTVGKEHLAEAEKGESNVNTKRKVQWTDAHGQELAQIKEFERSDSNPSSDEGIGNSDESCTCVIQ